MTDSVNNSSTSETLIKVGIIGGAGYTGGELIRILLNHPKVDIAFINSKSNANKPVSSVHADLVGETDIVFTAEFSKPIDVLFLCVGHGDARKFLSQGHNFDGIKIIDLSQDFRLLANATLGSRNFVYGLPELNKEAIKSAENIANPGCFASAIQLGLLPLAKAGLLKDIYATGITGSTGAGQALSETTHFSWRANNISAYKTLTHQHLKEIVQSLVQLQPSFSSGASSPAAGLYFVPWRGDFARGIYISATVDCDLSLDEVNRLYKDFYGDQPFTHLSDKMIDLKQVVNTNKCLIHIEKAENKIVIHSTIDNLVKGASGQAVQNMNLMFGLEETAGLRLKGVRF